MYKTAILIGEKAVNQETNRTISDKAGFNHRVVAKVLSGDPEAKVSQVVKVAEILGFEVEITFKPKVESFS